MKRSTQVIGFAYLGMAACILLGSIPTALAGGYDEAVSSGPFTPLVAEAAETYWTPERRASALPVPLPFVANAARGQHWHILGYPQGARDLAQTPPGPQFDGKHIEICAAAFATTDLPSGNPDLPATNGVGCDQTGGTSGGPWVVDFSGVGGATNFLNGNNSYRYNSPNPPENLKLYSPYFGDGAVNLRNAAQAVPVP